MRHNFRTNLCEWIFRGIFIVCSVLIGFKLHDFLAGQGEEKVFVPVALTPYKNDALLNLSKLKSQPELNPNQFRTVHPIIEEKVKNITKCNDKEYTFNVRQHGEFLELENYIRAEHGPLRCSQSVTYVTHGDYTYLDNVIPVLERWNGAMSIAIHAPGTDYLPSIESIQYLRNCLPKSNLVRKFVSFHIYFSYRHMSDQVMKNDVVLNTPINCDEPAPYAKPRQLYKVEKNLTYPINVGRNIARNAALTYYVFVSDIELYPSPDVPKKFLEMISENLSTLQTLNPAGRVVFPLSIFEIDARYEVPWNKTKLLELIRMKIVNRFHKNICSKCHRIPKALEWETMEETGGLSVFHIEKRIDEFKFWEPIFIGTNNDPLYDERLNWDGKKEKMPQGYAMCVLDYEFHILDNAFLVHRPGIKKYMKDGHRLRYQRHSAEMVRAQIYTELKLIYGERKGCEQY